MFKLFIITALIAFAAAVEDDVHAEATVLKSDVRADGFDTVLETTNHIHQVASGDEHGNIHGEFDWVDPHGEHVAIKYTADEHGYHPEGAVIPTPHPIPEAILRSLEYLKAHPSHEDQHH